MTPTRWTAALISLLVLVSSQDAAAQSQCRGTQQYYKGACRYPDEINKMKAADAAQAAAAKKQREEAQRKAADAKACSDARSQGTADAWNAYLASHATGSCVGEAKQKIAELQKEPAQPPPEQPTPSPSPDPPPTAVPAPAAPASVPPPVMPQPYQPDQPQKSSGAGNALMIAGFSVAGAGLIIFAVGGGLALDRGATLEEECPNDVCTPEKEEHLDDALAAAHATTAGLVIFGAGAAVGLVGVILNATSSSSGSVHVTPTIGLGSVGLQGTF